jgi:hypothetical protein
MLHGEPSRDVSAIRPLTGFVVSTKYMNAARWIVSCASSLCASLPGYCWSFTARHNCINDAAANKFTQGKHLMAIVSPTLYSRCGAASGIGPRHDYQTE